MLFVVFLTLEDNFLCLFPAAVFLSDFSSIVPFFRCPVFVFRFVRADVYHSVDYARDYRNLI